VAQGCGYKLVPLAQRTVGRWGDRARLQTCARVQLEAQTCDLRPQTGVASMRLLLWHYFATLHACESCAAHPV